MNGWHCVWGIQSTLSACATTHCNRGTEVEQREKSKLEADKEKGKVRGRMGEKDRKKGTAIVGEASSERDGIVQREKIRGLCE